MSIEKSSTPPLFLTLLERYQNNPTTTFIFGIRIVRDGQFSERQLQQLYSHAQKTQNTLWQQFQLLINDLYDFKQKIGNIDKDGLEAQLIINIWITFILLQDPYNTIQNEFIEFLNKLKKKFEPNSSEFQLIGQLMAQNTEALSAYLVKQKNYSELIVQLFQYKKNYPELKLNQELLKQIFIKLTQQILNSLGNNDKIADEIKTFIELIERLNKECSFFDTQFLRSMSQEVLTTQIDPTDELLTDRSTIIAFFQKTQLLYYFCKSINHAGMINSIVDTRIKALCDAENSNYLNIIAQYINSLVHPPDKEFAKKFIEHTAQLLLASGKEHKLLTFLFKCNDQSIDKQSKQNVYQAITRNMKSEQYVAQIEFSIHDRAYLEHIMEFVNATINIAITKLSSSKERLVFCQTIGKLFKEDSHKVKKISYPQDQVIFAAIQSVCLSECLENEEKFQKIASQIDGFSLPATIKAYMNFLEGSSDDAYNDFSDKIRQIEKEMQEVTKCREIEQKEFERLTTSLRKKSAIRQAQSPEPEKLSNILVNMTVRLDSLEQNWLKLKKNVNNLEKSLSNKVNQLKQENQAHYQKLQTEFSTFFSSDQIKIQYLKRSIDALTIKTQNIIAMIDSTQLTEPLDGNVNLQLSEVKRSWEYKIQEQTNYPQLREAFLADLSTFATLLQNDTLTLKQRTEKMSDLTQAFSNLNNQVCQPTAQIEQSLALAQHGLKQATDVVTERLKAQIDAKQKAVNSLNQSVVDGVKNILRYKQEIVEIDKNITSMLECNHDDRKKSVPYRSNLTDKGLIDQEQFLQQVNLKITDIELLYQSLDKKLWWTRAVLFIFETILRNIFENFDFMQKHKNIRKIHQTLAEKKAELSEKKQELIDQGTQLADINNKINNLDADIETLNTHLSALETVVTAPLSLMDEPKLLPTDAHTTFFEEAPKMSLVSGTISSLPSTDLIVK